MAVSPSTQAMPSRLATVPGASRGSRHRETSAELCILDERRIVVTQGHVQARGDEAVIDRGQARRLFRVMVTHVMQGALVV
jgi:hypothetical protein